jgi:hypothetical protein
MIYCKMNDQDLLYVYDQDLLKMNDRDLLDMEIIMIDDKIDDNIYCMCMIRFIVCV